MNKKPEQFTGEAMTYYGRWTYKYEEASRQGAAGAIIIHETAPASYDWSVVKNSWSGPQFGFQRDNLNKDRVNVEVFSMLPVKPQRSITLMAVTVNNKGY